MHGLAAGPVMLGHGIGMGQDRKGWDRTAPLASFHMPPREMLMPSKLDAVMFPGLSRCPGSCRQWVLGAENLAGSLSRCWWREDIPGHRGAAAHSPGPSGVQSSRQESGWFRGSALPTSLSLQCQLLPLVPARFGAWGPSGSPLPSRGCWWSCEATVLPAHRHLLLAPTLLLRHGAGSTLTDPDQHAAASVLPDQGSALHPSSPSPMLPTPTRTPNPMRHPPARPAPGASTLWL